MRGNAYTDCRQKKELGNKRSPNSTSSMSRKNRQPLWLNQLLAKLNRFYVNQRLKPQLDGCGEDFQAVLARHLDISGPNIHLGDHVHVTALADKPVRLAVFEGLGRIDVGSYTIINPGVRVTSASHIKIGEACMLAMNCYLADADWHDIHHRIYALGRTEPITIGNNVWIGDSALITKGVTIGDNSVVGAYSVVTKDVPKNTIVAGNPAREIRQLDDSHLTTRRDLFHMEEPYEEFAARYQRELLSGNTTLGWLRSLILPNHRD